uniref:RRM domain-containing protein n=1 Tax=Spongospora subterranea TaxID=70186 RepID=A0A0H5QW34_9EUKA|eukprot:CRZ05816.1 hypothetical protein [Spongospora subterranea]
MNGITGTSLRTDQPRQIGLRVRVSQIPSQATARDLIQFFSEHCGPSLVCTPERQINQTGVAILEFASDNGSRAALKLSGFNLYNQQIHVGLPETDSVSPAVSNSAARSFGDIHPDRQIHHINSHSHHHQRGYIPPHDSAHNHRRSSHPSASRADNYQQRHRPPAVPDQHLRRHGSYSNRPGLSPSSRRNNPAKHRRVGPGSGRSSPERGPRSRSDSNETSTPSITPTVSPRSSLRPLVAPALAPGPGFTMRWASTGRWANVEALQARLSRITAEVEESRRMAYRAQTRVIAADFELQMKRAELANIDMRLDLLRPPL